MVMIMKSLKFYNHGEDYLQIFCNILKETAKEMLSFKQKELKSLTVRDLESYLNVI